MSENAVPQEGSATLDFSLVKVIGLSSGLISINADTTPAQLLTSPTIPGFATGSVVVADLGGGAHTLQTRALFASVATPPLAAVPVPHDVPTVVLTLSVPGPGLWYFTGNVNTTGAIPPAGTINARLYLLNGPSQIGETTQELSPAGVIVDYSASCISILLNLVGGETITLNCDQHSAAGIALNAVLDGVRLGV